MSEDPVQIFGDVPRGRVLDDGSQRKGYVGSVGPLREHTAELGELLRRHIREIADGDLEQHGKVWLDTKTGDQFRIVTSLVDPGSPGESQVEAFVVRGGMTVYLQPIEAVEQVKVIGAASFGGWQA